MKKKRMPCRLAVTLLVVVMLFAMAPITAAAATPFEGEDVGVFGDNNYSIALILLNNDNNGEQLTGAAFELYNTDVNGDRTGDVIDAVTDEDGDGIYYFTGLSKKEYAIVQTLAPAGYAVVGAPVVVNLEALEGASAEYTIEITNDMENDKLCELFVTKVRAGTITALTGAEFDLYDADSSGNMGNRLGAFNETGTTGEYEYPEALSKGIYYVVETKAPAGYVLNAVHQKVEIDGTRDTISIEIENVPETGTAPPTNPTAPPPADPQPGLPADPPAVPSERPNPPTTGKLVPDDDGNFTELDENDIPLGDWTWDEDLEEWIFEAEVPLASIPATGDSSNQFTLALLCAAALCAAVALIRPRKRAGGK